MSGETAWITLFTIATAAGATLVMIVPGLAIAWLLARGRFRGRLLLETLVSLPLVMPPVATGLILLMLCSLSVWMAPGVMQFTVMPCGPSTRWEPGVAVTKARTTSS